MTEQVTNILPVTATNLGGKYWQRPLNFSFAARDSTSPLVFDELIRASLAFPIAFKMVGSSLSPVALLGIAPNDNLLLDSDLKWIGKYVPAHYRSRPFRMMSDANQNFMFYVEQNDSLISDDQGIPIFDVTNNLQPETQEILDFLIEVEKSRIKTLKACEVLVEFNLLIIWNPTGNTDDSTTKNEVLYRVDETRIKNLSRTMLSKLRDHDVFKLIYSHVISLQHIESLMVLDKRKQELSRSNKSISIDEIGFKMPVDDGTLRFD